MIYKHFSSKSIIESIYSTKRLWLTKLINCTGQEDFCLTEKMFFDMLCNLDFSKIKYNSYFLKNKFIKMCKSNMISNKYKFYDDKLYGACITIDGTNEEFQEKFGKCNISFELDAIKRKNTDFLFIYDVIYSLKDTGQYVYDLSSYIYIKGEYQARRALEFSEDDLPDNFEDMLSRLFYYMKVLYKLPKYKFERETRIIIDDNKIKRGIVEEFYGTNYHYTNNILKMIYGRHLMKENDKYILLLDSFPEINLIKNV